MNEDYNLLVIIVFVALVAIVTVSGAAMYNEKLAQECKLKALEKNNPVLEIMELCK